MKKAFYLTIFLFTLLLIAYDSSANSKIDYFIIKNDERTDCLDMRAITTVNETGVLTFMYPDHGVSEINITADKWELGPRNEPMILKIKSKSGEKVQVDYRLCSNNSNFLIEYPIIERDFVHLVPYKSMIIPLEMKNEPWDISITTVNFPRNAKVLSSNTFRKKRVAFREFMGPFFTSSLIIGDVNIEKFLVDKRPVFLTIHGKHPSLDFKVKNDIKRLLHSEHMFWQDKEKTPLLATLLIPDPLVSVYGRRFHNAMIMSFPKNKSYKRAMLTLSHELTHEWLGLKMHFPVGKSEWFYEGINDYLGAQLALHAGVINKKDYVEQLNYFLLCDFLHPFKHVKDSELEEKIREHFICKQIGVLRGHKLALYLSSLRGGGKSVFDNPLSLVILDLFAEARQTKQFAISDEMLEDAFNKVYTQEEWLVAREGVESGKISLPEQLFDNQFVLKEIEMDCPKYAFDVNALFSEKRVKNLKVHSQAYQAGLREGMIIHTNELNYNSFDTESYVIVKVNDVEKRIDLIPEREKRLVPQYVVNEA